MILADGEALHAANPDSFEIPPLEYRRGLKAGEHAKMIFDDAERMWVEVVGCLHIDEKVVYQGRLANIPTVVPLEYGDVVVFEPKHVIDIYSPEPEDA